MLAKNKLLLLMLPFLIANVFVSCKKANENTVIDLSESSNLAVSEKWALINTVYVAFRSSYDDTAEIKAPGRLGDIYCIRGHHITAEGENWYLFDKGWLPASSIVIYDNKLQAQFAAKKLE